MATLTEAEIALIRLDIGDGCSTITDPQIQAAWDAADGDQCKAYARIAWWLYVQQKPSANNLGQGGAVIVNATAKLYYDRYKRWADCAGIGLGALTAGVIDLALDQPCPDDDPECWGRWP